MEKIRIETSMPFRGRWKNITANGKSADSVVGRMYDPFGGRNQDRPVVKWSRRFIGSSEDALGIGFFIKRSLKLYKLFLGEEYLVPTSVVVGAKRDGQKDKIKVYLVQPYIDGWDGKTLPNEMRTDSSLMNQWEVLYVRLSGLYTIARSVNEYLPKGYTFPITLTVGDSREKAIRGENCSNEIPHTPNILINRHTLGISLCDFGRYTIWKEEMQEAYDQIGTHS